jgi:hypothetical protein
MILFYISIISPQGTHQSRTIHRFSHGKKKTLWTNELKASLMLAFLACLDQLMATWDKCH